VPLKVTAASLVCVPMVVSACHERGLVHAYWAANLWALYLFADRVLARAAALPVCHKVLPFLHVGLQDHARTSPTSGLVGRVSMAVLPDITPAIAAGLAVLAIIPALVATAVAAAPASGGRSRTWVFEKALAHVGLSAFFFGWHTHEKAILVAILPLGLIAPHGAAEAALFLRLSGLGIFALFPLFTHPRETPTKVLLYLFFMRLAWCLLGYRDKHVKISSGALSKCPVVPCFIDWCFIGALGCLFVFSEVVHPLLFHGRFEFLPLMLTSVVCAAGILLCWAASTLSLLRDIGLFRKK